MKFKKLKKSVFLNKKRSLFESAIDVLNRMLEVRRCLAARRIGKTPGQLVFKKLQANYRSVFPIIAFEYNEN